MNLAKLALDHSRITIIAMLMIVALGLSTYLTYPSAEDPTIEIRSASITASFPGMSAERVEELIAVPLEAAMREIAEIDEITSTSKTGSVKLKIEIRDEVSDLDPVFQLQVAVALHGSRAVAALAQLGLAPDHQVRVDPGSRR